jgi:hypothetical protein
MVTKVIFESKFIVSALGWRADGILMALIIAFAVL